DRRPGAALPGGARRRPVCRGGVRVLQPQADGGEDPGLRWPGVLALLQAAVAGALSLVAIARRSECPALGRSPVTRSALGRQPNPNPRRSRLASGGPALLRRPIHSNR